MNKLISEGIIEKKLKIKTSDDKELSIDNQLLSLSSTLQSFHINNNIQLNITSTTFESVKVYAKHHYDKNKLIFNHPLEIFDINELVPDW